LGYIGANDPSDKGSDIPPMPPTVELRNSDEMMELHGLCFGISGFSIFSGVFILSYYLLSQCIGSALEHWCTVGIEDSL